jgi:complement component 1 Q subcomponent-binding protein
MFASRGLLFAKSALRGGISSILTSRNVVTRATVGRLVVAQPVFEYKRNCSSGRGPSLQEVLANELAAEAADDEVDQEYLDAKKAIESTFKIHDEAGKGVVKLEGKYKGESIEVTFDCQDEEDMDMTDEAMERATAMDDDERSQAEDDDDIVENVNIGINFDVTITKKDESKGKMVVSCTAAQSLSIQQVRYVPAGKELSDQELYGGPTFDQLDESLQDAFYTYLAERGINEDLSFFILAHSGLKEQKEYENWLNKLMEFSAK